MCMCVRSATRRTKDPRGVLMLEVRTCWECCHKASVTVTLVGGGAGREESAVDAVKCVCVSSATRGRRCRWSTAEL